MEYTDEQRVITMYSDLVSKPLEVAKEVYQALDYQMTDEFYQTLVEEAERASKYKSKHNYDVSTHGLTIEELTEGYADVFERYSIPTVDGLAEDKTEQDKETA